MSLFVHATCLVVDAVGCLLLGPSGAGKSDLALRLIMDHGAKLVSDDQVAITLDAKGRLIGAPPAALAGLIEVRGLGILRLPWRRRAPLQLAFALVPRAAVERLPGEQEGLEYLGVSLPLLRLTPFEASAPHKVRLAVGLRKSSIMRHS